MFLAGQIVAMVTCYIKRITTTCLPIIGTLCAVVVFILPSIAVKSAGNVASLLFLNRRVDSLLGNRMPSLCFFNGGSWEIQNQND